jgi:hypothetical protein
VGTAFITLLTDALSFTALGMRLSLFPSVRFFKEAGQETDRAGTFQSVAVMSIASRSRRLLSIVSGRGI